MSKTNVLPRLEAQILTMVVRKMNFKSFLTLQTHQIETDIKEDVEKFFNVKHNASSFSRAWRGIIQRQSYVPFDIFIVENIYVPRPQHGKEKEWIVISKQVVDKTYQEMLISQSNTALEAWQREAISHVIGMFPFIFRTPVPATDPFSHLTTASPSAISKITFGYTRPSQVIKVPSFFDEPGSISTCNPVTKMESLPSNTPGDSSTGS